MISQTELAVAKTAFLDQHPEFDVDSLRATEYRRLDEQGHVYLDYTGGGLYAQSQVDEHMAMLRDGVWGNPHSHNPTSQAMTDLVEQARAYVLTYFNADPTEYDVIFTPNASGALKLVGESYPFTADSRYVVLFDNHNSVNGIREFARGRGADVTYIRTHRPEMRVDPDELSNTLEQLEPDAFNLFAFPGQSNFTGVKHDLRWIDEAQTRGWHVLMDAAAYTPTNRLDLSQYQPDFVSMSFYKMFGYPTGIGALVARKAALSQLQRPWFAGGTISITSVQGPGWHFLNEGHAAFEDGTVNYLSIPAVEIGLRHIESVGIDHISDRVRALTGWLLEQMDALHHSNGRQLVQIYGPLTTKMRGGTITFNLDDPEGIRLDDRRVEMLGGQQNISLRTGCFCNPGSGEIIHEISRDWMAGVFDGADHAVSFNELYEKAACELDLYPSSVRISVGLATNFEDAHRFVTFLKSFVDRGADTVNTIPVGERRSIDTA
jgi:molybdenum cofactor sulfurtransferase